MKTFVFNRLLGTRPGIAGLSRGLGLCSGDVLHQDYPGFRVYAAANASCAGAPGDCGHYAVAGADVRKK